MRITTVLFTVSLVTACLGEEKTPQRSARAPQGRIQYSHDDGNKINWKYYAPYIQWKSHLENTQRNQRQESDTAQPIRQSRIVQVQPVDSDEHQVQHQVQQQLQQQPEQQPQPVVQTYYKPYSMVPAHIKQLIFQMYHPQLPYVDPAAYVYQTYVNSQPETEKIKEVQEQNQYQDPVQNQYQTQAQSQYRHPVQSQYQTQIQNQYDTPSYYSPKSKARFEKERKLKQGQIQYKEDSQSRYYVSSHQQSAASSDQPTQEVVNTMPAAIQQLLYLQAQTPYHVIANRIYYQPKSLFVPKPIPVDEKNPYKYPAKVYYLKDETTEPEHQTSTSSEDQ